MNAVTVPNVSVGLYICLLRDVLFSVDGSGFETFKRMPAVPICRTILGIGGPIAQYSSAAHVMNQFRSRCNGIFIRCDGSLLELASRLSWQLTI